MPTNKFGNRLGLLEQHLLSGDYLNGSGRRIKIPLEATMAELDKQEMVTMQELIASSLAQTDALTKLLIEKGIITKQEFMVKLSDERAE